MKKIRFVVLFIALTSLASCTQKAVEEVDDYMPPVVEEVTPEENMDEQWNVEEESSEMNDEAMMEGDAMMEDTAANTVDTEATVKEFEMTSFTEMIDGKPNPQFSTKEIEVNQGDTVRISITTTSGTHDFNLDEFNVAVETPLNETVVVEFVADQAGTFEYYCSMPGHRANGHWGTLIVR